MKTTALAAPRLLSSTGWKRKKRHCSSNPAFPPLPLLPLPQWALEGGEERERREERVRKGEERFDLLSDAFFSSFPFSLSCPLSLFLFLSRKAFFTVT